ncbi:peptidase T [Acetonema longum]|uniref:Peptidase T n=1 Tax=Acetonema longum DSM 6540 TaxID=1009370 RepID=F7NIP2_9FIRM|nr:peptidase T [Acetonema longum]EGO64106.1 peptidase T [Acetonema longum DSM 6540]
MSTFNFKTKLVERFFRYAAVASQSKTGSPMIPSTPGQMALAELLQKDLTELGLKEIKLTQQAILTAKLPASLPSDAAGSIPAIGFLAHLDTVDVSLCPDVKPRVVKQYDGSDILLNQEQTIWLKTADHKEILNYIGQDIIVSDGTSVLGADNKAAISSIMVALEYFQTEKPDHGDIYIAFVPDEEVGLCGSKAMDLADFPVAFAYTIDSCELGEVVYETFNAGNMEIAIKGVPAHPMSSKGVMVNPVLVANDIINHFDAKDTPEHTDGKQGYFWVKRVAANANDAHLTINIRDFDQTLYEARKTYLADLMKLITAKHPKARISYEITDTYSNIADSLDADSRQCIDFIYQAMANLSITPKTIAMRGGTDGSALSARGLPTPNFFTGAHNFHSNCEFLPVDSFEKSCRMVLEIAKLVCKRG